MFVINVRSSNGWLEKNAGQKVRLFEP